MNLTYTADQYDPEQRLITIKLTSSQFAETIKHKTDNGQWLMPFVNVKSEKGKVVTFAHPGESASSYWYENKELKIKLKLEKE